MNEKSGQYALLYIMKLYMRVSTKNISTLNLISQKSTRGIYMWAGSGRRRRCRGRPKKQRFIQQVPPVNHFIPFIPSHIMMPRKPPVYISYDEFEALRLVDHEGLSQEDAGKRMNISRGTVWRLIQNARKKIITALLESREILIVPTIPSLQNVEASQEPKVKDKSPNANNDKG